MFLKIFKHAFKRPSRNVLTLIAVGFALALFAGVTVPISNSFNTEENYKIVSIFSTLKGLATFTTYILFVISVSAVFSEFKKSVATDEAYFTFTIPASAKQQLFARFLAIFTWLAIIFASITLQGVVTSLFEEKRSNPSYENTIDAREIFIFSEMIILALVMWLSCIAHSMFGIMLTERLSQKVRGKGSKIIVLLMSVAEVFILLTVFIVLIIYYLEYGAFNFAFPHHIVWIFIILIGGLGALCLRKTYLYMGRRLSVG